jgi:hypothetical protein
MLLADVQQNVLGDALERLVALFESEIRKNLGSRQWIFEEKSFEFRDVCPANRPVLATLVAEKLTEPGQVFFCTYDHGTNTWVLAAHDKTIGAAFDKAWENLVEQVVANRLLPLIEKEMLTNPANSRWELPAPFIEDEFPEAGEDFLAAVTNRLLSRINEGSSGHFFRVSMFTRGTQKYLFAVLREANGPILSGTRD